MGPIERIEEVVVVTQPNDVFVRVAASPETKKDLASFFSFEDKGSSFIRMQARRAVARGKASPAQRRLAAWDGRIHLFHAASGNLYRGLLGHLITYCAERRIPIRLTDEVCAHELVFDEDIEAFLAAQNIPFELHKHQRDAFDVAVKNQRALVVSPTSSGKSLIIFLISRWLAAKKVRHLVIVGRKGLALQLRDNFTEYGGSPDETAILMAGKNRDTQATCVIATWQSIRNMSAEWFRQFGGVIGDEVHTFHARVLRSILERLEECPFRIGLTGTLDDSKCHEMILTGLFGKPRRVARTSELIERGISPPVRIKIAVLTHPSRTKTDYDGEMEYLTSSVPRNRFILSRAAAMRGNVLVLYRWIDTHGRLIFDLAKEMIPDRPIYFVHGGIDADERNELRGVIEAEDNAIVIASTGIFSTGISINRLHHLILATPMKDRKQLLQSIGRLLRLASDKDYAHVLDIADILYSGADSYSLRHLSARVRHYEEEKFPFEIEKVTL